MTILSLWWWAITGVGVVCIFGATFRYREIATAQNNADAVALAYVNGHLAAATQLANALNVTIVGASSDGAVVTITIRRGSISATAMASP